jgi:Apea-like HEPN
MAMGDLKIQGEASFSRSFESTVEQLIPGMGYEIEREQIISVGRPQAMLVITRKPRVTEGDRIYGAFSTAVRDASLQIDSFLSAARLATGATIRNMVEVEGQPGWFKKYRGSVSAFLHPTMPTVDRAATMDRKLARNVSRLSAILTNATPVSRATVPSLALAVGRFNRGFLAAPWTDSLVDLTIALEAAVGEPDAKEDVTLRIRSRAAGLLATADDPASDIFSDLGKLYDLRSDVVHGHPHRESRVKKVIESISATEIGIMPMDKVDLAIDRLRDITRRAILARLFLAKGSNAIWPLGVGSDLDRRLTDDRERRRLRAGMASLGLSRGCEKAVTPHVLGSRTKA